MAFWELLVDTEENSPPLIRAVDVPEDTTPASWVLGELSRLQASSVSQTFDGILDAVASARTVVIEYGYFDLDGRSEDAATLERQYRFERPLNLRFHFFQLELSADRFRNWRLEGQPTQDELTKYLGYVIVRNRRGRITVGRSLVRPVAPPTDSLTEASAQNFESRVRTLVTEEVHLYGVRLWARGVPLMEQDGALTTCGHVTAWMAHYTAVLQHLVPRRTFAQLRGRSELDEVFGRQYPSPGLLDSQIVAALKAGGLSSTIVSLSELDTPRNLLWHHRADAAGDKHPWLRENITVTVARYLNSGFPVLLARRNHVVLICGYLRNFELRRSEPAPEKGRKKEERRPIDRLAIGAFVVNDEALGPYQIVKIDEIIREDLKQSALIIPLPDSLTLSGYYAELIGSHAVQERVDELLALGADDPAYDSIRDLSERMQNRRIGLRSYVTMSEEFKASVRLRCSHDPSLVSAVTLARLPRFVWVVELVDRDRREDEQTDDYVVGQVVIDASASSALDARVTIIHLPGLVEVQDLVTQRSDGTGCAAEPFRSGRWTIGNIPGALSYRGKGIGTL